MEVVKVLPALLMSFAALLGAFAQVLFKQSAPNIHSWQGLLSAGLIGGVVLYVIGFSINVLVYSRQGVEATRLYPFIALSYVFLVFLGAFFLGEKVTAWKVAGSFAIVAGVGMMYFA